MNAPTELKVVVKPDAPATGGCADRGPTRSVDDGADHLDDYPEGRWPRQSSAKLSPAKAAEKAEK